MNQAVRDASRRLLHDPQALTWGEQHSVNSRLIPTNDPKTLLEYIDERLKNEPVGALNLLSGLSHPQRQQLLARSTIFNSEIAQEVMKAGLREDAVLMLLAGTLEAINEDHPSLILKTLDAGEFFGDGVADQCVPAPPSVRKIGVRNLTDPVRRVAHSNVQDARYCRDPAAQYGSGLWQIRLQVISRRLAPALAA